MNSTDINNRRFIRNALILLAESIGFVGFAAARLDTTPPVRTVQVGDQGVGTPSPVEVDDCQITGEMIYSSDADRWYCEG